jgi:hypothetical protein
LLFLADITYNGIAGTVNNHQFTIDLDALSNAATVLAAIQDRSFAVALQFDFGSATIDFATLSGDADVTAATGDGGPTGDNGPTGDPAPVPEPSTFLLLGAGLLGVGLARKGLKR